MLVSHDRFEISDRIHLLLHGTRQPVQTAKALDFLVIANACCS
jgi:hypothetical protein